jgi:hypothetical protein
LKTLITSKSSIVNDADSLSQKNFSGTRLAEDQAKRLNQLLNAEDVQHKSLPSEETLVADSRAHLSPAQMVDGKLISLLNGVALSSSQLQEASWRRKPQRG